MTATLAHPETTHPAVAALEARLATLKADRDAALDETVLSGSGDAADRATNVDAHVRLAVLEERISDVEAELYRVSRGDVDVAGDSSEVRLGSTVTVDFGDGPEAYVVSSVDLAPVGAEVVTPGSPLGRALVGAVAGDTVEYRIAGGRTASVTVLSVA
ncbi:GreA/GreB family elongation factor [Jatrophihabitans sp. YIM 134969]